MVIVYSPLPFCMKSSIILSGSYCNHPNIVFAMGMCNVGYISQRLYISELQHHLVDSYRMTAACYFN